MARPGIEPERAGRVSEVPGSIPVASGWRDPESNRGHHDFQ
ncbi:MAG: hypothetical protein QOD76_588, partial [Solirubrobacteraceae bacterium]|nr:hypothetical protein [Solirubrobacteraceae bacterium]